MLYIVTCYGPRVSIMRTFDDLAAAEETANSLTRQHPELIVTVYRQQTEQLYMLRDSAVLDDESSTS
jgi:hypothetical protein